MPGIYGIASGLPIRLGGVAERMFAEVSSCRDIRFFTHHSLESEHFSGFSLSNRAFADLKAPRREGDPLVLFDGNIFNLDRLGTNGATYCEAVASLYRSKGAKFAADLRGHFVIALLDKRAGVLRLYADPVAAKPLYYMHHDGALYFASELKALLPVGPLPKRIDPVAISDVLHNGFVLGERTLVREVAELKSGGMLEYRIAEDRLENGAYYEHFYRPRELGREEELERVGAALVNAFDTVLGHCARNGQAGIVTVTGGLDSRALAVAARKASSGRLSGVTHCFHDEYETRFASGVCKALGMEHIGVNLEDGGRLARSLDDTVVAGEAMVHFNDTWRFVETASDLSAGEFGIMHTGVPGSAIMGALVWPSMIPPGKERNRGGGALKRLARGVAEKTRRASSRYLLPVSLGSSENGIGDSNLLQSIAPLLSFHTHKDANEMFFRLVGSGGDHWATLWSSVREAAGNGWQGGDDWALVQERLRLHSRQIKGTRGLFRAIEERMDFSAPFWDLDLVRVMLETPAESKAMGKIYYRFLRERFFPSALIRLASTRNFGPLRKNVALGWAEHVWKRKFLRGVIGRFSKEYRRTYGCSYEHVVRTDSGLRNFMADILRDFDELAAYGVDAEKWRRLVEEWRVDPRPYLALTRHFFWLMYLKRWFDLWGKYVSTSDESVEISVSDCRLLPSAEVKE